MSMIINPYRFGHTVEFDHGQKTTGTSTLVLPSGIEIGDIVLVANTAIDDSGPPSSVIPDGFSVAINQVGGSRERYILSWKIADALDASRSVTVMSGGAAMISHVGVFRGSAQAISAAVYGEVGVVTTGDPAALTISSGVGVTPLISLAYFRQYSNSGQTFTPTQDGAFADPIPSNVQTRYKIFNTSPLDVTIDAASGGGFSHIAGCYLEVSF